MTTTSLPESAYWSTAVLGLVTPLLVVGIAGQIAESINEFMPAFQEACLCCSVGFATYLLLGILINYKWRHHPIILALVSTAPVTLLLIIWLPWTSRYFETSIFDYAKWKWLAPLVAPLFSGALLGGLIGNRLASRRIESE